ncbi:hypothetical protein BJX99DRAFT_227432 [Aspergillus californicus]
MPSIKNTTVLIIGGTSGIGLGVAEKCLAEGAHVHIASSKSTNVEQSTRSLKTKFPEGQISGHICDLRSDAVEQNLSDLLSDSTSQSQHPLDHIVFTAGDALSITPISSIDLATIREAGHIRFVAPLLLAKLAPQFMKPGYTSSLIFTTGSIADKPMPNWSLVNGYMTGLIGATRNLALDLKPLRVNIVSPGAVHTPMWGSEGVTEEVARHTLLGKVGTVEEVAEAYVYLMKDSNATGACINTNSGAALL